MLHNQVPNNDLFPKRSDNYTLSLYNLCQILNLASYSELVKRYLEVSYRRKFVSIESKESTPKEPNFASFLLITQFCGLLVKRLHSYLAKSLPQVQKEAKNQTQEKG